MSAPAVAFLRHTQALTRDGFCCTHTHVQVKRREGMLWWSKLVDVELAGVSSQQTVVVRLQHDDKLQEGRDAHVQVALLYTSVMGERRIR